MDDHTGVVAGLTWSNDNLIINGKIGSEALILGNFYALGATYKLNDRFDLGLDCINYESGDPIAGLKATYHNSDFLKFSFTYFTDNPIPAM